MGEKMLLNVYDGDYGVISMDVECIKSILYARIAKVPLQVKVLSSLHSCLFRNVPSLVDENDTYQTFDRILSHLKSKNYNIDCGLSAKQASEAHALINMVTLRLDPALKFTLWVDKRNSEEFTNPWYMKALPIFYNVSYIKRSRTSSEDLVSSIYPLVEDMEVVKDFFCKAAGHTLSALSTRLGGNEYFFGSSPVTLDVIVFSYLTLLKKLPLPSCDLTNLLSNYPNLIRLMTRIDSKYFSELKAEAKYLKRRSDKGSKVQDDDEISYLGVVLMAVSASTLMVYFVLSRGIIKITA